MGTNIKLSPSALREKLNLSSVYKQAVTKITDTCERHTSASALSSPLMPIYTWLECQWVTDWHTLTDTGFPGSAIGRLYSGQSHVQLRTTFKMGNQNKSETKDKQGPNQVVPLDLTHTCRVTDRLTVLTVFQCCGGYSLACSWDPVRGSLPWCHCRYKGPGRRWHCPPAERRASPPTSRAAARPACPCTPQNGHLWWAYSSALKPAPLKQTHKKNPKPLPPPSFFCFSAKRQSAVTPHRPSIKKIKRIYLWWILIFLKNCNKSFYSLMSCEILFLLLCIFGCRFDIPPQFVDVKKKRLKKKKNEIFLPPNFLSQTLAVSRLCGVAVLWSAHV